MVNIELSWNENGRIFVIKFKDHVAAAKAKDPLENYLNYVCSSQTKIQLNWLHNKEQNRRSTNTVYLSNLSEDVTMEAICKALEKYGTVERVNKSNSIAFVDFTSKESIQLAILDADNIVIFLNFTVIFH